MQYSLILYVTLYIQEHLYVIVVTHAGVPHAWDIIYWFSIVTIY